MKRRNILKALGATAASAAVLPWLPSLGGNLGAGSAWAADTKFYDDDRILGDAEAPVTIIEYASLTCSHCATFNEETLPQVKAEWIETGKARMVFRHFPLDGIALRAAAVSDCLEGEAHFTFIDALFRNQNRWARAEDPITALGGIARIAGMDEAAFQACVADEAAMNKILERAREAAADYDIQSTPSFVINGRKVAGALPYEDFAKVLSEAAAPS